MCTIVAAVGVWPESPLVIAANRDEALDRPAAGPSLRQLAGGRRVLAPRDLKAGGSWLGVNRAGLFAGLTNRFGRPPDSSRRSRGELIDEALAAGDRQTARRRIEALGAPAYNPFHLLLGDREGAQLLWSDGERLHHLELSPGINFVTERSFDAAPSRRHDRLAQLAAQLSDAPAPSVARWRAVLADHQPYTSGHAPPPAGTVGLDAICVHAEAMNYGTRSSTLVLLGRQSDELRLFHAAGRPCEHELEDQGELVRGLLTP